MNEPITRGTDGVTGEDLYSYFVAPSIPLPPVAFNLFHLWYHMAQPSRWADSQYVNVPAVFSSLAPAPGSLILVSGGMPEQRVPHLE